MPAPPPCRSLGRQCRELAVTLSVASADDDAATRDALATWLTGHAERITFGTPYVRRRRVVVDAIVHVPCRYLEVERPQQPAHGPVGARHSSDLTCRDRVRCGAHGFAGTLPPTRQPADPAPRRHGDGTVSIHHRGGFKRLALAPRQPPRRSLPVMHSPGNPCLDAPCRTADNRRGAACCRDLTLEILASAASTRSDALESFLRSRKSPYLCKVERADADIIECEVISACGYLDDDRISCVLHDRVRPDGNPAKPFVCSDWPDLGPDDEGHPGCRLV